MVERHARAADEELLRASGTDASAFGAFYDRYEAEVLRFFVRATGRADLAADLTAEVFAGALSSLARFDPEIGMARTWLFGIARHELADAWRRGRVEDRARWRLGLEPLTLTDEELERIDGLDDARALELLAELPDDQRLAVQGRVIEERDYADLAAELQCSESVVRSGGSPARRAR